MSTEEVHIFLKEKLLRLGFKPGQLLTEKEIISNFNLSRMPVRQALSRMEREGLVEIIPRKGAFVKFLSIRDIVEIFQVRKALEGLAANLAAERVDLEKLNQFENYYLNALKTLNESPQEISDLGIKFHEFIINSAENQRIKNILKDLRVQLEVCRIFFLNQNSNPQPSRTIESIKEHISIIEAIKNGDKQLAEAAMKDHIANAEKYILTFQ